jgi:uncharacterized protein involved in outer membrane biogenesis
MRKPFKIILIGLALFLCLSAIGAWYAISFVNPAQLTNLLSSSVKAATGRDLKITGPVTLKLLPSISVKADQVSLSNAPWASAPEMLSVKNIELEVKLLPLFLKRVEISAIRLSGLDAHLQANKAGQNNWDLTPPTVGDGSGKSPPASGAESDESNFVAIETITVSDARIHYLDGNGPAKIFSAPKFSLNGGGGKTMILLDLQYQNYKIDLKGKTSSLRQTILDWNQNPVKMNLDLTLTLNGKALNIEGEIDKAPKTIPQFDIKLKSKSFDLVPLAVASVAASSGNLPVASKPLAGQNQYFFSNEALPLDVLPSAKGKITVNIDQLGLPDKVPLTNLSGHIVFIGSRIDLNDLKFALGKGQGQAQASITDFQSASPNIAIKLLVKGFSLEQILLSAETGTKVSGGDTQLALNLQGKGKSLHQFLSTANGVAQVSVGKASLGSNLFKNAGDLVITILNAVNPLHKSTDQTNLECAVAYLPVNNGIVTVKDSVGVQTDKLDITLSGTVNLSTEAINLNINPNDKSGLTTGIDLGGLVKIGGTLLNPQTGINKQGVISSAASIGLGILTAGISIAAENAKSLASKRQPCKAVLHPWQDIYPEAN